MSVRKRIWQNRDGSQGQAWVVAYTDQGGTRRMKNFDRRRDADAFHATVGVDVRRGLHVPDSQSILVAEAAQLWLESTARLERSTRTQYGQHVGLHIVPLLGAMKLSQLTVPVVRSFEDKLAVDRSPAMVRKILTSLGSILADAQERGLVAQNVVRGLRSHRRGKDADRRRNGKLKVGVDIPTPDEVCAILAALDQSPRWRPLFLTAPFTGLRASELRGLRWSDLDLKRGELHVRQRADRYNRIGPPKSDAGERTVPLPPMLVNVLRTWKLACPKGDLDLVFPNGRGGVEDYSNIIKRGLRPIEVAAGVVTKSGKAKYPGLHSLRHFYASWCINRRVDGGLELPLKLVQVRLGHASIQMTADRYGHLFPRGDDGAELAAAEKALVLRSVSRPSPPSPQRSSQRD
jgi:integrase